MLFRNGEKAGLSGGSAFLWYLWGGAALVGITGIPGRKGVQAPYGARVQAAFGLAPWAAQVLPTERAGSKGSMYSACGGGGGRPVGSRPPLVAGATTFPAHFVVGLWMLGSDVNLSLWQQRRENIQPGFARKKTGKPRCARGNTPLLVLAHHLSPGGGTLLSVQLLDP